MADERPDPVYLDPNTGRINPAYIPATGGAVTADTVTETASRTFVSPTERATWNGKQAALTAGTGISIVGSTISSTVTGGGGGSTTGDVITWSASALNILANGTDISSAINTAVSNGKKNIWFNAPNGADYTLLKKVTLPSDVMLMFNAGNRIITGSSNGTGTMSASGTYPNTITGNGSLFITEMPSGTKIATTGVLGISGSGGQGTNYSDQTYFTVTGNGTGATLQAVIGPQGQIYGAVPINRGYNYTSATITITDPTGNGSGFGGATAVLGSYPLGTVKAVQSNTSLTLREPLREALPSVPVKYFGGVISGGVIDASDHQQIIDPTVTLQSVRTTSGRISMAWYGAKGDNTTDNAYPFQRAAEDFVHDARVGELHIPSGIWLCSKSILFRIHNDGGLLNYSITLSGAGNSYEFQNNTLVKFSDKTGFGFGLQRVKGGTVKNMRVEGANQISYGLGKTLGDQTATFVHTGVRDHPQSPNSIFSVDPVGTSAIGTSARYPGWEHHYNENGAQGSTDITFTNLDAHWGVVLYCVSPSGTQQNAESIKFDKISGGNCKVGMGFYNTQTRQVTVEDVRLWSDIKYAFDNARYGQGGVMAHVNGANLSGCRWIVSMANTYNEVNFERLTSEICGGIGGVFIANNAYGSGTLNFDRSDIRTAGANPPDAEGVPTRAFQLQCRVANLTMTNSRWSNFEGYGIPFNIIAQSVSLTNGEYEVGMVGSNQSFMRNVNLVGPGTDGYRWSDTNYLNENQSNPQRIIIRGYGQVGEKQIQGALKGLKVAAASSVTSVNEASKSWTFTISPSDAQKLSGGDEVVIFSQNLPNEFDATGTMFLPMGKIDGINTSTGVITMKNLPFGINPGVTFDVYVYQSYRTNAMHVGLASGTSITNVLRESGSTSIAFATGDAIVHTGYEGGFATITNIAGTTITVNKSNSVTGRIGFSSFGYKKMCTRNSPNERTGEGFKIGDEIYPTLGTNPTIDKWRCSVDGIVGSSYAPSFSQVNLVTP